MNKRAKPIFLILGLVFSLLAGIVIGRALRYKHPTVFSNLSSMPEAADPKPSQPERADALVLPLQEGLPPEAALSDTNPDAETKWMKFDQLDLLAAEVSFDIQTKCDGGASVIIPPIKITAWHSGVFEGEEFGIGKNVAVAWEHLDYSGLWIHSGWDFWSERSPATDLQYFIETDSLNEVQPLAKIENRLNECLRDTNVTLQQNGQTYDGEVTAAVRVPAVEVAELSRHTMDLVPYLAQAYPQSGFASLEEGALLIYFCGRAALDERTDPNAGYWTQTRYIIALEPVE